MLILTRRLGEAIHIGDNIIIKVVEIDGKQVKLGIEAPQELVVLREEVYERIKEQNIQATDASKEDVKAAAHKLKQNKKSS